MSSSVLTAPPRLPRPIEALEPIEDTTRRQFITGVGAAALAAAFLAACGDDDDPAESTPEATSEVRSIEHMYGTTEITGIPSRVVTVGWTEQDALLALGVVPVGTTAWVGDAPGAIHPWAEDELGDAALPEVLDDGDGIQFERIATLEPDLIVALYVPMGLSQEDYNRLSAIAPTIAPPAGVTDGGISWQDLTRTVGIAVGKEEQAAEVIASVEARFTQAKEDHPEFVGALGINAYPSGDSYQAYPPPDPGGQLMTALGFVVPPVIVEEAAGAAWVEISAERVSIFDIDVVLWLVEDDAKREMLLADPLYAGLDVAKEGRHVFLAYDGPTSVLASATSMQTVLSLPFLLDAVVPMLAAALDGDPATEPTMEGAA
ncbi:MAG: iron-siderophore ABC transporter substrate-binding protein [Dehalococcoidia bacterium]|jgi:iron complex transport system substrate-binding protein|nr:iron-siderophore ABC transporter substrate-binding protein [Dehalococcoidia bacterium]